MALERALAGANEAGTEQAVQPSLWENYLEEGYGYERPKRGDLITGTIMEISPQALWVDIGVKRDGMVPAWDLRHLEEQAAEALRVGDEIPVFVVRPRNREGNLILSITGGQRLKDWQEAERLLETGEISEREVKGVNSGGLVVSFGQLQGFVPASHVDGMPRHVRDDGRKEALTSRVGEVLPLRVIDVDRAWRRLVLSHRLAVRERRRRRKEELLQTLAVGDVRTGRVAALYDFGAFVDIGGADGLVHRSEICHERIRHPRESLELGQEVEIRVVRLDHERQRIGLSIKQLQPDPWNGVTARYAVGQLVEATISNIVDFGAFAELEPGVEGLIHVSKLSNGHVDHPREVLSVGDTVTLRVLHVDGERKRISLGLKDAPQWVEVPQEELRDEETGSRAGEHLEEDEAQMAPPPADALDPQGADVVALLPERTASVDDVVEWPSGQNGTDAG
jgi:small subunit ribosomal protein S1